MAHLTPGHIRQLYDVYGELKVLDDIIRYRALDDPPTTILGYPKFDDRVDEYETFTGKQLDEFVDAAVHYFMHYGLRPVRLVILSYVKTATTTDFDRPCCRTQRRL
jgi:hypothetical protein